MGVPARNILHIGDNRRSDYKRPRERGLCAYRYPHLTKTFLKNNIHMAKFYREQWDNLGASVLVAVAAIRDLKARMGISIAKITGVKLDMNTADR